MLASLKSRLALSNLAISLAALVLLTLVFGQVLRQRTIDSNEGFVQQEAALVQDDVRLAVTQAERGASFAAFYGHFRRDSNLFKKQIVFFSAAGGCSYDSGGPSTKANPTGCLGDERGLLVQPGNHTSGAAGLVTYHGSSRYVVQRPTGDGSVVALIAPGGEVIPNLSVLAPGFLLAVIAAAGIWLVMSLFFGYTVIRPLAKISAASRAIAAGDYTRTVEVRQKGEIGELAGSFNHMVTQVRLSNQTLKDFVANVSHDLRTPITVISGFAGSIVDGTMQTPEEIRDAGQIIESEARRMERLVDDLLQLTRLEAGLRRFDRRPVSIHAMTDRTIRRVETATPGRTVVNSVSEDLPLVLGDEELLERVLMNLLNNALSYTPESGSVTVSAQASPQWITVRVADTGSGISTDDQSRIFERFFRGDKSRGSKDGHTGLGLPIVREIVEAHGGTVSVSSRPGAGSTFSFTVPVNEEGPRGVEASV